MAGNEMPCVSSAAKLLSLLCRRHLRGHLSAVATRAAAGWKINILARARRHAFMNGFTDRSIELMKECGFPRPDDIEVRRLQHHDQVLLI